MCRFFNAAFAAIVPGSVFLFLAAWMAFSPMPTSVAAQSTNHELRLRSFVPGGENQGIAVDEARNLVFIGAGPTLLSVDVSDPSQPRIIGQVSLPDWIWQLELGPDDTVYVAVLNSGLHAIDMSDPTNPVASDMVLDVPITATLTADELEKLDITAFEVGFTPSASNARVFEGNVFDMAISSGYLFVANWKVGFEVYSLTAPLAPVRVGHLTAERAVDLTIDAEGNRVFFKGLNTRIQVIDIVDPEKPRVVAEGPERGRQLDWQNGQLLAVDTIATVYKVDASNTFTPVFSPPGAYYWGNLGENEVYLLASDGTYWVHPIDGSPPAKINDPDVFGIWSAEVVGGLVYALSRATGLHIVDVTVPATPRVVGSLPLSGQLNNVDTVGSAVYAGNTDGVYSFLAEGSKLDALAARLNAICVTVGVKVVYVCENSDLLNDDKVRIFTVDSSSRLQPAGSLQVQGSPVAFTVRGQVGFLLTYNEPRLQTYDLQNPDQPVFLNEVALGASWGKEMVIGDDGHVYIMKMERFMVVDATNPRQLRVVSDTAIAGDGHGIDIVEGRKLVVVGRSKSDVNLIDVADPTNPRWAGWISTADFFVEDVAVIADQFIVIGGGYESDKPDELRLYELPPAGASLFRFPPIDTVEVVSGVRALNVQDMAVVVAGDGLAVFDLVEVEQPPTQEPTPTKKPVSMIYLPMVNRAYPAESPGSPPISTPRLASDGEQPPTATTEPTPPFPTLPPTEPWPTLPGVPAPGPSPTAPSPTPTVEATATRTATSTATPAVEVTPTLVDPTPPGFVPVEIYLPIANPASRCIGMPDDPPACPALREPTATPVRPPFPTGVAVTPPMPTNAPPVPTLPLLGGPEQETATPKPPAIYLPNVNNVPAQ